MTARILLADDEVDILRPVGYLLRQQGFEVDEVTDGEATLDLIRNRSYDLLICDVIMPGMLGTDLCRVVRAESNVPIILLTAKDAEVDRVLGLELGADDYVTKPFSSAELVSRVRALLRRRDLDRTDSGGPRQVVGGLSIDVVRHEVDVDGRTVELTASEFRLLSLLADQPGRVFSREQIMQHLWQTPYVGDARACDVHISNLRRKIERDAADPKRIVTVRAIGYKLVPA